MEAFRLGRSKSTNRSSDDIFGLTEGNRWVQKQGDFPNLASDSSSCSSGSTIEDSVTFELAWRSSNQAIGIPMKKLLAVEMSRETESKRRSPSVIARLMGLDGLPSQPLSHKQQKRSAENHQQRTTSADKAQRSGTTSGRRSFRKSSKDDQEFKDVFEVLDASKMESGSYSSQGTANSNLSEAEMAFIRQKFMDVKRLSTDENLQVSKEFDDALEALDSNKDLLLKFLEQPDSLFTKHLHDLQGAPPQSHFGRTSAMKSSHAPKCELSGPGQKAERETSWKNHCKSSQKHHEHLISHSCSKHTAHNMHKSSIIQLDRNGDNSIAPTRIVVLKPNIGKAQNVPKAVSSPRSSHDFLSDCGNKTELLGIRNREADLWGKKNLPDDGHKSRESREIAKEITRQMRESFSNGSMKFSASRFKGYGGDARNISEGESSDGSEVTILTSRDTLDRNNRYRPSSSRSAESSVSREAKKRLSERWRMTHKSQEIRLVTRGSTLGEMLAIPDRDARSANQDHMIGEDGLIDRLGSKDGSAGWVEPLGISSRDGWKNGCAGNLPRSRSLPALSAAFGSPKTNMRCETFRDDKYVMPRDFNKPERKKTLKGNSDQRERSSCRKSRSGRKRSLSSGCSDRDSSGRESSDTSPELHFSHSQVKSNFKIDDSPQQNFIVPEASVGISENTSSASPNMDVGQVTTTTSCEPSVSEPASVATPGGPDSLSSQDTLDKKSKEVPFHRPVPDLDSPASSKEAEQPSPVSILEAPFTDDLSSCSDCFESLSADLHGLRMQLQLLKLESDAYTEGPMLVSSDEDAGEGSVGFAEEKRMNRAEENWESSYIADVLTDSGLSNADPDTFLSTMHSPECPVSPLVFEELEKKYRDLISGSKSQRKLLFDRINSKLLDIYRQFIDPHPWASLETRVCPKWNKNGVENNLRRSLLGQDKKVKIDANEKVLGRELEWLELGDEIDVIGKEIERLLINDLVAEVLVVM